MRLLDYSLLLIPGPPTSSGLQLGPLSTVVGGLTVEGYVRVLNRVYSGNLSRVFGVFLEFI